MATKVPVLEEWWVSSESECHPVEIEEFIVDLGQMIMFVSPSGSCRIRTKACRTGAYGRSPEECRANMLGVRIAELMKCRGEFYEARSMLLRVLGEVEEFAKATGVMSDADLQLLVDHMKKSE